VTPGDGAPDVETQRVALPSGPELHVERSGEGDDVLVVLHGGPGLSCEYLEALHQLSAPNRAVLQFDQAGGGRSTDPRDLTGATLDLLIDDLRDLLDHFGIARADLLGHSFGTILALQFALDHPDRVRSIVLASGGASVPQISGGFLELLLADQGRAAVGHALSAEARGDLDDPRYWAIVGAFLEGRSLPEDAQIDDAEAISKWKAELGNMSQMGLALWGPYMFTATGSARDWDVRERLGEITVPVLAICGRNDYAFEADVIAMADALPQGEYVPLGEGHEGYLDGPDLDRFLELVDGFLRTRTIADPRQEVG
jgi:proline iminopeptidase